jgi:hypothetical protein
VTALPLHLLISIEGWADLRDIVGLEGFDRRNIPVTQSELKPTTFRLAAQCNNPSLLDDNGDNHKKFRAACLLAENIWIRNTASHLTKSFDRVITWETGWISMNFILPHVFVSSSVRSLASNDTSENNRNSVFKLPFQTPYTFCWWNITNTKMSLTSLHLRGTFTFQQRCHTRHPWICSLGRHLYKQCCRIRILSNISLKRANIKTNYLTEEP